MSSYWEKLVDLYVDGECSSEERSAIEARAKVDQDVRRAIQNAEDLRGFLRKIPNKPPKEFETRLRDAIMNSPAWDSLGTRNAGQNAGRSAINAPRVERVVDFSRVARVFNPFVVGTVATIVVAVVAFFACFTLSKSKPAERSEPFAQMEQRVESSELASQDEQPWKLIPSPEGNAPESSSKFESQENYWAVIRVADAERAKKLKRKLQTQCAELDVSFSKSDEDEQIRLKDVSNEQWAQIAKDWNESEYERSEALTKWAEGSQERQTIRVAFKWGSK